MHVLSPCLSEAPSLIATRMPYFYRGFEHLQNVTNKLQNISKDTSLPLVALSDLLLAAQTNGLVMVERGKETIYTF